MSELPPIADIARTRAHFREVPKADIRAPTTEQSLVLLNSQGLGTAGLEHGQAIPLARVGARRKKDEPRDIPDRRVSHRALSEPHEVCSDHLTKLLLLLVAAVHRLMIGAVPFRRR
jgi:hypothetical protein